MRRNYTVHLALAAALVLLAALVGQVRRWEWNRGPFVDRPSTASRQVETSPSDEMQAGDAADRFGPEKGYDHEVLVRFRAGVSEERIQAIASRLHDRVEDEIESVNGLVAVEDLSGEQSDQMVRDYASLDEVEYAEPNEVIRAEPLEASSIHTRFVSSDTGGGPNDPLLTEQWGLINTGQREGKAQADISALAAWSKTHGSERVVVAVLDSGVDYTHPDLMNNIWHRPADLA